MKKIWTYIKLTFEITKSNFAGAMEYRLSFLAQTIGMILNDVGLILVWVLFFGKFQTVNGWGLHQTVILFSVSTCNFALIRIFAGGTEEMAGKILGGQFDTFLTLPKNVLWQASVDEFKWFGVGDFLFGLGLFIINKPTLHSSLLFVSLTVFSSLIIYNAFVIFQSLTFYFGDFEETADRINTAMMMVSLYPESAFSGVLRFATFYILPVFAIVWVPVRLLQSFNWILILAMFISWLATFIVAMTLFKRGLRRYESGNLINVKV